LDCCRNEVAQKGDDIIPNAGTFLGRFITVYTVQQGKKEYVELSSELSPGTEKMVNLINKCKSKEINLFNIFNEQLESIVNGNVSKTDKGVEEGDKLIKLHVITPFTPSVFLGEIS
jgi:hypothetical protein